MQEKNAFLFDFSRFDCIVCRKLFSQVILMNCCQFQKNAAVFLSGAGTNAEVLLRDIQNDPHAPWRASVLVTDRPETSRARELAAKFQLPLVEHDIVTFYRAAGEAKVSIRTGNGMRLREEWTDGLRAKLAAYPIDFGIHAGFITLCNITADYPCLNVHPGDLTVMEDGKRVFAGLHLGPTEYAILAGYSGIRSSVIVAQQVSLGATEMDEGPILGISGSMPLDLCGYTLEELQAAKERRAGKTPAEYANDILRIVASRNVDRLKEYGDWEVFPRVVRDYAAGAFTFSPLKYHGEEIRTVVYKSGCSPIPVPADFEGELP